MENEPKPYAKRLPKEAQELIYTRLIAGASNAEVRQALADAGYPGALSHSTIFYYRKSKRVRDAIALYSHEEYQSGLGLPSRRIAVCKEVIADCLRRLREGKFVEVAVPAEVNGDGDVITPETSRMERKDLPALEYQRLASVMFAAFDRLTALIDSPGGIYKGAVLPAIEAEAAAEEAAKGSAASKSPVANWTQTQKLAFWNDMVESIVNEARAEGATESSAAEASEPDYAHLLVEPSPSRDIPAGVDDEDDFGDDD